MPRRKQQAVDPEVVEAAEVVEAVEGAEPGGGVPVEVALDAGAVPGVSGPGVPGDVAPAGEITGVLVEGYVSEAQKRVFREEVADPWPVLYGALDKGAILQQMVIGVEVLDGGPEKREALVVSFGRVRGVIPEDEVGDQRPRSLRALLGTPVMFKVKSIDRRGEVVYLSRREARAEMAERLWAELRSKCVGLIALREPFVALSKALRSARQAGDVVRARGLADELKELRQRMVDVGPVVTCAVTFTTDTRVFADIGGVLVTIPLIELSHRVLNHPREFVSPGDVFDIKLTYINPDARRVSGSLKALLPSPWLDFGRKYRVHGVYLGTVARHTLKSVLIELEPGIKVFAPHVPVGGDPPPGAKVSVYLTKVDVEGGFMSGRILRVIRPAGS